MIITLSKCLKILEFSLFTKATVLQFYFQICYDTTQWLLQKCSRFAFKFQIRWTNHILKFLFYYNVKYAFLHKCISFSWKITIYVIRYFSLESPNYCHYSQYAFSKYPAMLFFYFNFKEFSNKEWRKNWTQYMIYKNEQKVTLLSKRSIILMCKV